MAMGQNLSPTTDFGLSLVLNPYPYRGKCENIWEHIGKLMDYIGNILGNHGNIWIIRDTIGNIGI
jgi:hypothetical protein